MKNGNGEGMERDAPTHLIKISKRSGMLDVLLKIKTDTVARYVIVQCLRGMNKYGSPNGGTSDVSLFGLGAKSLRE